MNLKPLWGMAVNLKALIVVCVVMCSLIGGGRAEAVEPKIATGVNFTVYLAPDGTVWAWGDNSLGQIGQTDLLPRTTPTQIPGLSDIVSIAAGYQHALALKADGTVWAWGRNYEGELGQGSTYAAQATPLQVPGVSGIGFIACGGFHSMALTAPSSILISWGYNVMGQLGNGNTTTQTSPVNTGFQFRTISGGYYHSVGIGINGAPYAWGYDSDGQLGNDVALANQSSPVLVAGGFTDVVSISAGASHSLMCRAGTTVYAWGDDGLGQLGNGAGVTVDQPTPISIGISGWKVLAGAYHSNVFYPGGYVYAFGDNSQGQCRVDPLSVPKYDSPAGLGWLYPRPAELVGGPSSHVMMTASNGALMGWGDNSNGQLGLGSTSDYSSASVNPPAQWSLDVFIAISAGNAHTLGLKADGTVWAWGADSYGQLGDDVTLANKSAPVQVAGITGAMEVCAGGYHSLALTTGGSVYAWGWDIYGQLGNDATIADSPTPVSLPLSYMCGLGAGAFHSLAVYAFGRSVRSWGYNGSGQLGDGTTTQQPTPTTVSGLSNILKVEAGYQHSLALSNASGTVYTWGADWSGQLGNDVSMTASNVPVTVTLSLMTDIAAGQSHSTSTRTSALTRSWGADYSGQLGNGATAGNQPTPTVVDGPSTMKRVAAGADFADFSVYLSNGGLVYSCGSDGYGQLGDDVTAADQPSLVQVAGLSQICAITAGDYHGVALAANGTLYGWGYNGAGQLGNDAAGSNSPTPVVISTDTWKPTVSVSIIDSSAGETGPNPGTIRFTRSWANAGAVTVNYNLSGTAVNGTDYTTLSGVAVIPANSTTVDVVLSPIDDSDDEDNESIDVTLLTGTHYRVGSPSTGSIVVSDNDTSGFIIGAVSGNTTESGGVSTFTIRLATRPSGNVVLNFASTNTAEGVVDTSPLPGLQTSLTFTSADGNWNADRTVTVIGQDDPFDDGDIGYFVSIVVNQISTLDSRYDPLDPLDPSITNTDNDVAGVVVSLISDSVTESGDTATFTITLTSRPYNPVNFTLSSSDTTEGVLEAGSNAVTIDPADWATGATITVQGVDDDIDDGNLAFKIDLNKSTSSDPAYNNLGGWDVAVVCRDDDTKGVTLSSTAVGPIAEGASTTYTLNLNSRPIGAASVVLNFSGGAQLTVDADGVTPGIQSSLTIPAAEWATLRTITITAIDDPDIEGAHSGTVTTTVQASSGDYSSGVAITDVNCSITDNDTPGFTVAPTTSVGNRQITTEAGGTATFAVRLKTRPTGAQVVAVRLNSNDLTEGRVGATPISLTSTTTTGSTNRINFSNLADLSQVAIGLRLTVLGAGANTGTQTTVSGFSNSAPKYIDVAADVVDAGVETVRVFPAAPATFTVASTGADNGTSTFVFADATDLSSVVVGTSIAIESVTSNATLLAVVTAIDNVAPGKSITVNPYIGSPAVVTTGSPETLRFALPMILTFSNADWNIDQAVTVTGIDDAVNDNDQNYGITFDIATGTTDANYALVTQTNQLMKNLDDDIPGVAIVQTLGTTTVTEADVTVTGQDTFSVRLNTDPGTFAVVTLATNGQVTLDKTTLIFTPTGANAYNLPQTVTVTAVNDAVDEATIHDGAITFSISGYGAITTADPVVCQVTDNDTAGISVVPTLGLVTTENLLATNFAVSLASQPTGNVTIALSSSNTAEGTVSPASVVFTTTNWYLSQSVTVTGVNDDVDDGDQSYGIVTGAAASSDSSYNGVNPPDVVVVNVDNDTAGVTITQTGGSTTATEGGATDTFTVVLNSRPAGAGSVTVTLSPGSQVSLSSTSLTFTQPAGATPWNVAQTVTVTAVNDNVAEGSHSTTVGFSASGTAYTGLSIPSLTVSITDNDSAGTTVSAAAVTTTEAGGTGTFTFNLNTQPTANVTVVLASNDTTEGAVSPSSLTFTPGNFSTIQTVTLTGVDDSVDDGNIGYGTTFTLVSADPAYNNLAVTTKAVTNTDNDTAGFTITPISNALREDGTSGRFTVRLTSEPTAAVTIGVAVSDATEAAVSAATLTFDANNWNDPQEVTVSGIDDSLNDGNIATSVVLSADTTTGDTNYDNLDPADVAISTEDDDQAGVVVSVPAIATTETGSVVTFTVQLLSEPSADVTIPLSSSDTTEATVAPGAGLTFTSANWNVPQTVTVTPVDDFAVDGSVAYTVVLGTVTDIESTGYTGLNPTDVTATNADNDAAAFTLSATTATTSEGATASVIQVVLTSQPSANVTLTITGLVATEGSLSATTLTFTPTGGTAWNVPQDLTITGVNDAYDDGDQVYTLTLDPSSTDGAYNPLSNQTISVTNTDNDAAGVVITQSGGTTVVAETGTTDTYTVQLASRPIATATITVTPDSQVRVNGSAVPIVLTFNPALSSPAANGWDTVRTITVSAVVDTFDEANPHAANITHTVANYVDQSSAAITASPVSVTVNDNDPPQATVTSLTVGRGSSDTITTAMISATDDDTLAANLLFTVILAPGQGDLWLDYGQVGQDLLINGDTFTQAAITANRLTYRNSGTPNASDGFAFRVSDTVGNLGDLTIFDITVTGFIPPTITLNGSYSPIYTENDSPVVVDNAPTVTDPDSVTYNLLTITLSGADVSNDDELFFDNVGNITASSNTISYLGTPIGTYTVGTHTSGTSFTALTASFNPGDAGDTQLISLLGALRYRNTSEDPAAGTRTVSIVLRDETSTENVAVTKDIPVLAINDTPTISAFTLITPKNVPITSSLIVDDVDNYPLTLVVTKLPDQGDLSGVLPNTLATPVVLNDALASRSFTYTPIATAEGTDTFTVRVTDPDGAQATATITVLIIGGADDRPWIVSDSPSEVEEDSNLSYSIVVNFDDLALPPQVGDVSYTLVGDLPPLVTFNGFTPSITDPTLATLSLTIGDGATGVIEAGIVVTETANDTSGYQPITIVIVPYDPLGN